MNAVALCGIGALSEGEQPLRLLGHHREIDQAPGQEQPQHRQHDLHAPAAVRRHRCQRVRGHGQVPAGIVQGFPDQVTRHLHDGELRAVRDDLAGKPGQQLDQDRAPAGEVQVEPVVAQ
jgi:hypothetical protein